MAKSRIVTPQKSKTAKSELDRFRPDPETVKRVKEQLGNKYLLAAALFAQKAIEDMPRVKGYPAGILSGIFHDHYLKATSKTPPGLTVIVNIPGMQQITVSGGQSKEEGGDPLKGEGGRG